MAKKISLTEDEISNIAKLVGEEIMAQVSGDTSDNNDIDTLKKDFEALKKEKEELQKLVDTKKVSDEATTKKDTDETDPVRLNLRKRVNALFGK